MDDGRPEPENRMHLVWRRYGDGSGMNDVRVYTDLREAELALRQLLEQSDAWRMTTLPMTAGE
jgi:hypothetical protein